MPSPVRQPRGPSPLDLLVAGVDFVSQRAAALAMHRRAMISARRFKIIRRGRACQRDPSRPKRMSPPYLARTSRRPSKIQFNSRRLRSVLPSPSRRARPFFTRLRRRSRPFFLQGFNSKRGLWKTRLRLFSAPNFIVPQNFSNLKKNRKK